MKKIMFLMAFSVTLGKAVAQKSFSDSISQSRNRIMKQAMIGLGAWSVVNISSGFIIANQVNGEAKYFWRMNAYWNFINLGLAGLGWVGSNKTAIKHYSFAQNMEEQHKIEKLYIFNTGLDLVYITGGFLLREHGNNEPKVETQDQFRGYGSSLVLQGGFLLVMDVIVYSLHHRNTLRMHRKLQNLELNAGPGFFSLNYKF